MKYIIRYGIMSLWFFSVAVAQASINLTANFDALTEGSQGDSFSDGGISFSNLDQRVLGPNFNAFTIDATTGTLPGFSLPNFLTFGGFVPGNTSDFSSGRFGSASIGFSGVASFASLDIFGFGTSSLNTLTLEAMLGDNVVASDTVTFYSSNPSALVYLPLSVSGTFDSLKLVAAGSDEEGTVLFGADNVSITVVPEPSFNSLVGCVLAVIIFRRFCSELMRNSLCQRS